MKLATVLVNDQTRPRPCDLFKVSICIVVSFLSCSILSIKIIALDAKLANAVKPIYDVTNGVQLQQKLF